MSTPFLFVPTFSWPAAPGGLLYTYAAGGTSNKATYSDAAGSVPNANPVVLDSNGSATVRLGSGAYHFVLKDSTGTTTIWDQDNYSPIDATSVGLAIYPQSTAEIAASVTPTNYAYPPGWIVRYGTNTTPGTTDMTAALQAAINSCPEGGEVYLPAVYGPYKLASAISSTKVITLRGDGWTNSLQAPFGDAGWGTLSNFSGSILISAVTSGDAILLGSASANKCSRLRDLMIVGPGSGTSTGVHLLRGVGSTVNRVMVANFSVDWHFENEQDMAMYKPCAYGSQTGMLFDGSITSNQAGVYGVEVQTYTSFGIHISAAAQVDFYGGLVQDGRGGYGVQVEAASTQCIFDGIWCESTNATGAFNILGSKTKLRGCNFGNPTDHVFIQSAADQVQIDNCTFQPSAGQSPSLIINSGATQTRVIDSVPYSGGTGPGGVGATYQDNGTNTIYITTQGGLFNQQSGGRALSGVDVLGVQKGNLSQSLGGATTKAAIMKQLTGVADNTFTLAVAVIVPNAAMSARVKLTAVASLGAGGAIGPNEASATLTEEVIITRTAGLSMVVTTSTTYGGAASNVAGGTTCTVSFDNSQIVGGATAQQTLNMRVAIARGAGASTNHTCQLFAEVINANATGVVIS